MTAPEEDFSGYYGGRRSYYTGLQVDPGVGEQQRLPRQITSPPLSMGFSYGDSQFLPPASSNSNAGDPRLESQKESPSSMSTLGLQAGLLKRGRTTSSYIERRQQIATARGDILAPKSDFVASVASFSTQRNPRTVPSLNALPTVSDHTTFQLGPDGDEYIARKIDENGEKKITPTGQLRHRR
ncbi:hypothetical protein ONS96_011537 [Cadophora gregata f. sp. sojae]|nr:hypothetical protein ONS96_011537 [Cadophora gregata f. sp. sojae]